jgi:serine phosphatase RsbU (regulator of sigma subunit)
VATALKQHDSKATNQDGMDLALVALAADRSSLQYAGANNPLYFIRGEELTEVKADKLPIGGGLLQRSRYSTHTLALQPGDLFYLFSDGLPDQFGGERGKKYTYKRLREQLVAIRNRPLPEQGQHLATELQTWRGELEQVDDVLIIGVRV